MSSTSSTLKPLISYLQATYGPLKAYLQATYRPLITSCLLVLHQLTNLAAQPLPPSNFIATGYDMHIEVRWNRTTDPDVNTYRLYRADDTGEFQLLKTLTVNDTMYLDWIGIHDVEYSYYVTSRSILAEESTPSPTLIASTYAMSDEEFLDMVQAYTFRYFWDFAHPVSGLSRERNTSVETVTMGGSGFGLMAILVGIERGFITKEEGLARILKMVLFLEDANRFYGAFPHWMNGTDGTVIPFSGLDNGGDLVETAFLFEGLLTVREYFDGNSANEVVLRQKITNMWHEVNWNWYRNGKNVLLWHWSPNFGFAINHEIRGWNEALIIYLLAVASPTHPVSPSIYHTGWAGGDYINGFSVYGYTLDVGSLTGGPLFFAHYSFIGFDPRYHKDAYANYFRQNRNHTLINRAYCIDNPENHVGYSDVCWGLTASDDPFGYLAHEANPNRDNGTISPTAALSSMPYTPAESIAAMKHFYREHGERLWGPMGFYDAFNLTEDWFATSYLAIDQGPIICMIENYRTQLLWNTFMKNPEIDMALDAIGFMPDSSVVSSTQVVTLNAEIGVFPNPAIDIVYLSNHGNASLMVSIVDVHGRQVTPARVLALKSTSEISVASLPPGVFFVRIEDHLGRGRVEKLSVVR